MEFTIMPTGFRLRRVGITITITMTNYEHDDLGTPISYPLSPISVHCSPFTVY